MSATATSAGMGDLVLGVHVGAGAAALLLGPLAFLGRGPRRHRLGLAYQAAVAGVALTAVVLACLELDELWWLIVLALATELLALGALYVAPDRGRGGRTLRAHLLGGSYIALVTALLVAETGNPLFWVLPAVVGQLPIAMAKRRLHAVAALG